MVNLENEMWQDSNILRTMLNSEVKRQTVPLTCCKCLHFKCATCIFECGGDYMDWCCPFDPSFKECNCWIVGP
jgi:hypothetical protein